MKTITTRQVQTALAGNGELALLDVREQDEWDAGHAPGAHHIPLGQLGTRQAEIPTDREVVAVCRSGRRSHASRPASTPGNRYAAVPTVSPSTPT